MWKTLAQVQGMFLDLTDILSINIKGDLAEHFFSFIMHVFFLQSCIGCILFSLLYICLIPGSPTGIQPTY